MAWPPARLFYGVPRLDGVVPKHSSLGPVASSCRSAPHPFGVNGESVWLELHHLLLLLSVQKPPLAASLGGIVSVAGQATYRSVTDW